MNPLTPSAGLSTKASTKGFLALASKLSSSTMKSGVPPLPNMPCSDVEDGSLPNEEHFWGKKRQKDGTSNTSLGFVGLDSIFF